MAAEGCQAPLAMAFVRTWGGLSERMQVLRYWMCEGIPACPFGCPCVLAVQDHPMLERLPCMYGSVSSPGLLQNCTMLMQWTGMDPVCKQQGPTWQHACILRCDRKISSGVASLVIQWMSAVPSQAKHQGLIMAACTNTEPSPELKILSVATQTGQF